MKKTEEHLALLEDLVKDSQLESEIKEHDKKFVLLQDQKFAELESLKSIFDNEILTCLYNRSIFLKIKFLRSPSSDTPPKS